MVIACGFHDDVDLFLEPAELFSERSQFIFGVLEVSWCHQDFTIWLDGTLIKLIFVGDTTAAIIAVSTCLIEYNNKGMADCLSPGVSADIPIGITSGHLYPLL